MACLFLALARSSAAAGSAEYVLRDHLGVAWTNEPIAFTLSFPAGGGAELAAMTANGRPVRFQTPDEDIRRHPDGGLKSARVHVVTDLGAEQTIVFAGRTDGAPPDLPPPGLQVEHPDADHIVFLSDGFGVHLRTGSATYEDPVPASAVPGPVRALRLADGTWFGGSDLYGNTPVRAWSADVVGTGPVFGRVRYRYEYADGNVAGLTVTLHARSTFAVLASESLEDRPEDGIRLLLSPGLPPLAVHVQRLHAPLDFAPDVPPHGWTNVPLRNREPGTLVLLTPWAHWFWATSMPILRLGLDEARELRIERRHAGRWVEPAPPGTMRRWEAWSHKNLHFKQSETGDLYLDFNHAQGERHLQLGVHTPDESVGWQPLRDSLGRAYGAQVRPETLRLDDVKEMVLDWPASDELHPRLFLSRAEVEAMWQRFRENPPPHLQGLIKNGRDFRRGRTTPGYHASQGLSAYLASGGDPNLAAELALVEGLEWTLGLLGNFDRMRQSEQLASYYDLLIDSGLIGDEQRPRLRARMALVAYQLADPATWSIERGFRSYNPNMSVSYTLALGTVACLLRDHPMAKAWLEAPLRMTRHWLNLYVTPHGEWLESMHYAQVSAGDLLSFAVAAKQAGLHDFFMEAPMRRLGSYLAQQYTPPDPRHMSRRVTPTVGRGTAGMAWGHFGLLARAMRDTDPDGAARMQWLWRETKYATGGVKMGGFEDLYGDRTLPEQQPDWGSERFPNVSVILRHGVGHPHEHYLNYLAVGDTFGTMHPHEVGNLTAWFAHGQPVSMRFCSNDILYTYMRRLMNQVTPAFATSLDGAKSHITAHAEHLGFARLPLADYAAARYTVRPDRDLSPGRLWDGLPQWPEAAEGSGPVEWQRQVMFLRDDDPAGRHYLLLNDTILNDSPTRWHFWTLSHKLDATDIAMGTGFLDDAPGNAPAPARELTGDRFTARGLYGVDLDFFVAEPADTPRHTLRYGGGLQEYAVRMTEYQDLLHLQRPGRGRYAVVVVPRPEGAPAPVFERVGDGRILRVSGDFGDDFLLLSEQAAQVEADGEGIVFETAAGAVRRRPDGTALILSAAGRLGDGPTALCADGPAALRRRGARWQLRLDHGEPAEVWQVQTWEAIQRRTIEPLDAIRVEIRHPGAGAWELPEEPATVAVERDGDTLRLTVPRAVREIVFKVKEG